MPEVGDEFQGFRLVEELGRGTFGRVFLARQAVLAGRLVALKVTNRPTREPDRLARLQHTNVVPVYSVHTAGQCQLICMPFLGRRTLADALKSHRSTARSSSGWSGRVTRAQRGSTTVTSHAPRRAVPKAPPASPGPREAPADLVGDPAAVLRLLSQLAAGLDHAHGRGILHLDIKPGNVLIADTGEPMLLDFNLSVDASEADRELVGGTVPYMAPEQLQDMRSRGRGGVDARTDLYSLGVVAYELLAGEAPFPGTSKTLAEFDRLMAARKAGPPPLRSKNPAVTPAVEAVVRKLLAPDPAARYQSAADLKDDIDRQLADRPLRFARDRSVAERVGKWRRRNPRVLIGAVVALVVVAAGGSGAYAVQAADGRSTAEARIKARDAQERMHTLRVDLTVPDEPMYLARGVTQSRDLLGGYGLPDDANWRDRESFRRLPDAGRAALATDFGELLVLLGSNRLALATDVTSAEAAAARDEAARCVRAAADCFADGPTPPALTRLARELGLTADAAVRPVTARDYFLDAAGHTRSGRYAEAVPALEEATLLDPGHAAAQFLLAHSLACVGRTERAAERFAVSAGLMKTERRAYRQWGWAEMNSGQPGRAVRILDRAAGMSSGAGPDLRYLLGLSRLKLGKYEEAYADLTAAAAFRPVSNLLARAEARERLGDAAGAAADRRTSLAVPTASPFDLTERGSIQEATDPAGARADYRRAVAAGPSFPQAYQGLIRLALDRGDDPTTALRVVDEAVARFPGRSDFHAARAVALARLGKHTEVRTAVAAADRLTPGPEDCFRVAGALARSADPADQDAALCWLRRAYLAGVRDLTRYDTAQDLTELRSGSSFRNFRTAAAEMGLGATPPGRQNDAAPGTEPGAAR